MLNVHGSSAWVRYWGKVHEKEMRVRRKTYEAKRTQERDVICWMKQRSEVELGSFCEFSRRTVEWAHGARRGKKKREASREEGKKHFHKIHPIFKWRLITHENAQYFIFYRLTVSSRSLVRRRTSSKLQHILSPPFSSPLKLLFHLISLNIFDWWCRFDRFCCLFSVACWALLYQTRLHTLTVCMCVDMLCVVSIMIFLQKIAMISLRSRRFSGQRKWTRTKWRRTTRARQTGSAGSIMQCWENYLTLARNWLLVLFRSPTLRCPDWCVPLPSLLCFALPIEIANYLILDFASSTVPWWASKSAFFFTCALPFIHTNRFMKTTMSAHTERKERKQQRKELFL